MLHETSLITTMAVALALAFAGGFAASRLGLPPIVGYILAGVAIGPFTPGFVGDTALTQQLAEIGVVLLMFGVGIHFSLRDLLAVRRIAVPGAVVQSAVATLLGVGLGLWLGWGVRAGLVLGLAVSVASTVVLLRAVGERGELESPQGRIAIGWLIVEDLFTVLVLVLLPALTGPQGGAAPGAATAMPDGALLLAVLVALGKVALLGALMVLVGSRLVPSLLVQVARTNSRELFTLGVLAISLGIAYASSVIFGVSLALGAFLAGVVVSESDLSHQAAADALPLRDAFAVLFFVSVGMLFEPAVLLTALGPALAVLAIVIVGKPLAALAIVLLFGYPVRTALTVAAGIAQIGEFSFILAEAGRMLGLLPGEGYSLVIVGAVLSITLNPLLFRTIGPVETWLRAHPALLRRLEPRSAGDPARLPKHGEAGSLRGHAVICGFGQVGSLVGAALRRRGFSFVAVELERRRVESLRAQGIPAIYGDASNPLILEQVNLPEARTLVVALPDPTAARQVVEHARKQNPRLDIVVRCHSATERLHLYGLGVQEVVLGEMELGLELARHALHRFGVGSTEIAAMLQGLRLDHYRTSAVGNGRPDPRGPIGLWPSAADQRSLRFWGRGARPQREDHPE